MNKRTLGEELGINVTPLMISKSKYKTSPNPLAAPEQLVGIELELEDIGHVSHSQVGFQWHEDGSLRNQGGEFVTHPMATQYVEELLTTFFTKNKITESNYSERTSTHVHVNVLDHTLEQIASVALLYQVFERVLFNFVAPDRRNNIFCVPWCQANVSVNLVDYIEKEQWRNIQKWQKYTALNLAPMAGDNGRTTTAKGTLEYRHLQGTCDMKLIMNWINIITSLHAYAKKNTLADIKSIIMELNTSSAYEMFLQSVFTYWAPCLMVTDYWVAMEEGVIDAKFMLLKGDEVKTVSAPVVAPSAIRRLDGAQFISNTIPPAGWPAYRPEEVVLDDLQVDPEEDIHVPEFLRGEQRLNYIRTIRNLRVEAAQNPVRR